MPATARRITSQEGLVEPIFTSKVRHILTAAETEGRLDLIEVSDGSGCGIPPHVHTREDEIFHVLEGQVEFFLDGKSVVAAPGDVIHGPKNIPHGFRGVTDFRMYVTMAPSGMENMFHDIAAIPAGSPPDAVFPVCAKYGIMFLPPV